MKKFTIYKQSDQMDCGPTCLRMVAKHYGKHFSLQRLREICGINREGVSMLGISQAAEKLGMRTHGSRITLDQLKEIKLPAILHWKQNHFVVLHKITSGISTGSKRGKESAFHIADPAGASIKYGQSDFLQNWLQTKENGHSKGIALTLEPSPAFYEEAGDKQGALSFSYLVGYLFQYKKLVFQLLAGLLVGSLLQLI
ncbi:MAG: peptidase domain-containing ABC transporter, partial [Pedobacter sp.]